jgi:hypothetical protein
MKQIKDRISREQERKDTHDRRKPLSRTEDMLLFEFLRQNRRKGGKRDKTSRIQDKETRITGNNRKGGDR